jgi:hypothetical protein
MWERVEELLSAKTDKHPVPLALSHMSDRAASNTLQAMQATCG